MTLRELSAAFGLTHPDSVRNLIRRADRALLGSRMLRGEIEAIRHRLPKTGPDPAKPPPPPNNRKTALTPRSPCRYRKMQKTVYRVRTQWTMEGRLALDLLRERQAQGRAETTKALHKARAG